MIHYGWSPLLSWRDERWTYVESPAPELFDRRTDPGERRNVLDEHPEVAADLARRIAAIARDPEPEAAAPLDPETREKLLALGYVSSPAATVDRGKDPKELISVVNLLFQGIHRLGEGDRAGALARFQQAYRLDPDNGQVLFQLADCLRQSGDATTALAYYRRAVERDPGAAEAWGHLARLTFDLGKRDEAFALVAEGLSHSPRSTPLRLTAGDLHLESGDLDRAEARYREAAEADPGNPDPWVALARLEGARDRPDRAEVYWTKVEKLWPSHPALADRPPDARR
jgi:tetratricopeptide (TPR) repeat protein